jgi:hypothetical protein
MLADWFRRNRPKSTRVRPAARRYRPHLESLENRALLTAASYAVSIGIVTSLENESNVVRSLYSNILGRAPDATGFSSWVNALQHGVAPEAVEASFYGSAEFFIDSGNTASGFVTAIYENLLNRAPDSAGFNNWVMAINNGEAPVQVALAFTTSLERRVNLIVGEYRFLLNRTPSSGEINTWLAQYTQGMNNFGLADRLLGSDEFFNDQSQNNSAFIEAAYRDILLRQPSTSELNAWLNFMDSFPR